MLFRPMACIMRQILQARLPVQSVVMSLENSGGVHCLKYGLTTNNLLGIEIVTMEGEIPCLGGKHLDAGDYDLLGIMTGSEGLLGVVSEVTPSDLFQKPATARALLVGFDDTGAAGRAVGDVIAAGIIPAGMEMMDGLAINAAEDFANAGYPREACSAADYRT